MSDRVHTAQDCEKRLQALPNYDRFRSQPPEFICSCGRRWVLIEDEASGAWYEERPMPASSLRLPVSARRLK